jgi:serine/threonine protein kinase
MSLADYEIGTLIGKGNFGSVYQSINNRTGKLCAIKIEKIRSSTISQEIINLQTLKDSCNKFILCFYEFYISNFKYYIITELLYGYITMNEFVEKTEFISPEKYNTIFSNLCEGLKLIHAMNISHRDINYNNILISEEFLNVKYIDFGLSNNHLDVNQNICGSPEYIDISLFFKFVENTQKERKDEITFEDTKKADLWALGMIMYYLLTKELPLDIYENNNFYDETLEDEMKKYFGPRFEGGAYLGYYYNTYSYDFKRKTTKLFNAFIPHKQIINSKLEQINSLREIPIDLGNLLNNDPTIRDYFCDLPSCSTGECVI